MYGNQKIWNVTYPILLSLLAQNVINVTDTAFLGHTAQKEIALSASAMGGLLYITIATMAFGFSVGSQILIARRNGEENYQGVGPIMWQGSLFSFLMGVTLMLLLYFTSLPILRAIISTPEIIPATHDFMSWRVWGFLFVFLNVMFRSLYVGITKTKVMTFNVVVMACINVVLDYGLIFGHFGLPAMGIKGAALASVIAEASSLLFFVVYTYLYIDLEKYGLKHFGRFHFSTVVQILRISCFTMMQYFLSMALWFVFFLAIERQGAFTLAISNVIRSIYVVMLIPVQALSTSANTLVSNLIGAGGVDKVLSLLHRIARNSIAAMLVIVAFFILFPKLLLSVYTADPVLQEQSLGSLYVVCVSMLIASVSNIYFNGISGTGNTQAALYIEIGVQVFYALFVVVVGMWLMLPVEYCFVAEVLYYLLMLVFSLYYLKKKNWQDKKI